MLIVHHLGISQSERIVWLCEELEIPYQLVRYDRDPETRLAPKEYKALHPFETAPVIIDGDLVLAESGAIIEYIISKYGDGRFTLKANNPNFADYLFWYHFANGSMMPAMSIDLVVKWIGGETRDVHPAIKSLRQRVDRAFDLVEKRLGTVDYFAGSEFTAADIMMLFPLTTMRVFTPLDLTPYPNIRAYLKRIGGRPAYQRAMNKGDPDLTPLLD
jgi:glutathione S-transferase